MGLKWAAHYVIKHKIKEYLVLEEEKKYLMHLRVLSCTKETPILLEMLVTAFYIFSRVVMAVIIFFSHTEALCLAVTVKFLFLTPSHFLVGDFFTVMSLHS